MYIYICLCRSYDEKRIAMKYKTSSTSSLHWYGAWGDTFGGKLALRAALAGGRRHRICAGPLKIDFAFEPTMKLLSNIITYLFPKSTLLLISTNTSPKTLRLMRHRSNLGIDQSSFPSQTSKTSKSFQSHDFSSRRPQYFKSSISPWWKKQGKDRKKRSQAKAGDGVYIL